MVLTYEILEYLTSILQTKCVISYNINTVNEKEFADNFLSPSINGINK